jgi:hypothetical protein
VNLVLLYAEQFQSEPFLKAELGHTKHLKNNNLGVKEILS